MLHVNEETREIVAFNRKFDNFFLFRNAEHVVKYFNRDLQLGRVDKTGWAPLYKKFFEKTGYNPSYFKRAFNSNMLMLWWNPIPNWAREYCYSRPGKLSSRRISKFWNVKALVEQAHQDELDHLIPFIFEYGMDIPQIKKSMGKGTWRKICQNKKGRNKLLASVHPQNMRYWVDIASTLLQMRIHKGGHLHAQLLEAFTYMYPTLKQAKLEFEINTNLRGIIIDTIRMREQLGKPIITNWPKEKWKQNHDELIKLINAQRYSPELIVKPHEYELGSWRFVRCCSPLDIVSEGQKMHHCVASYLKFVRQGEYLIYSIYHDSEHIGTLGLKTITMHLEHDRPSKYFVVDQAQGPCNSDLPKEFGELDLREFISQIRAHAL